ncbi:hypothetical protein BH09PLA1_BH09PLA1_08540 [soil metagenome]
MYNGDMEDASKSDCPHCKRKSASLSVGQRCAHCGAIVCGQCEDRIAEIDDLLSGGSGTEPDENSARLIDET